MNGKVLLGIAAAAGLVIATWFATSKPNRIYSRSVSNFVAHPVIDELVRVQGRLVHGSVCKRTTPCEYRFRMTDAWSPSASASDSPSAELSVRYAACIAPDVLRDTPGVDLPLSVEGEQCATCHSFEASTILTRIYEPWRRAKPLPAFDVPLCAQL